MQQRHRLSKINDVNAIARSVDVTLHIRIPAMGLVAKMDASLEQLAHGKIRQCHAL
jgi:hypothetical protein